MATELVDASKLDACCTAEANTIRAKTGSSAQIAYDWANSKGFADAIAAIPSGGGGGLTTIASGTFFGDNNSVAGGRQLLPIGKKMAKTDFWLKVLAKQGEEYAYDGSYKFIAAVTLCFKDFGYFNISTDGHKPFTASSYSIDLNNAGTITPKTIGKIMNFGIYSQNNNINSGAINTFEIWRNDPNNPDFSLYFGQSNSSYIFPSTIEYNYEIIYFGNDPTNDIIDLS